jgi:hypothetical protein
MPLHIPSNTTSNGDMSLKSEPSGAVLYKVQLEHWKIPPGSNSDRSGLEPGLGPGSNCAELTTI